MRACIKCVAVAIIASQNAYAVEEPSPLALLRGVETVRTSDNALRFSLTLEQLSLQPPRQLKCLIELCGERRRFEILPSEYVDGSVILIDGDEIHSFHRKAGEDVEVYDLSYSRGVRGDVAFDPRIIGLADLMSVGSTVKACLWYEHCTGMTLVGQENVNGVNAWHIRLQAETGDESHFWIEEPSFRVHRRTLRWAGGHSEITSEYDPSDPHSIFPKCVHIQRVERDTALEGRVTLTSLERPASLSPQRFTLESMDLPKNTMISDYRLKRVVGYWNGEGVSTMPVSTAKSFPETPPADAGNRWIVLLLGCLLLALIVVLMVRQYRRKCAQT